MIDLSARPTGPGIMPAPRLSPFNRRNMAVLAAALAVVWSLWQAGIFGGRLVNVGGWPQAWQFVGAAAGPDLSAEILGLALYSALVTAAFALGGTALSVAAGIIFGILASETWWRSVLPSRSGVVQLRGAQLLPWVGVRAVLAVPRGIHEIVWGLFFVTILGLDPLTAILAIAIPYGAITAKVYADIIDETPHGSYNALLLSGARPLVALIYGLLPQALPDLLSYGFYRLECAVRSAAVLGLIGAGGLGYQILLSLQSLRYEQVWTFLLFLIALSGLTDAWSTFVHRRIYTQQRAGSGSGVGQRRPRMDIYARFSLLAIALLVPLSLWYVQADYLKLFAPRTLGLLSGVARDAFPPRLEPSLLANLAVLSAETLAMSIIAIALAGAGGLLLSYAAAANFNLASGGTGIGRRAMAATTLVAARGVLLVTRALPEAVWALVVLFVLFPGILPGAVGLGLYNLGVLGRLMAEVAENAPRRPTEALRALGASGAQAFLYGVLPATLPKNLAYILYRWEVCVRATVVVGIVGAGGLGGLLAEQLSSFDYRGVLTSLLFYVGLTFLVDLLSAAVRRTLR